MDLIERVADLQGQVGALQHEWAEVKATLQKGWQRVEKANERAEKRSSMEPEESEAPPTMPLGPAPQGFAKKLLELRGVG